MTVVGPWRPTASDQVGNHTDKRRAGVERDVLWRGNHGGRPPPGRGARAGPSGQATVTSTPER